MPSEKQKLEGTKAAASIEGVMNLTSTPKSATVGGGKDGKPAFLRMPREVRNQIYEELLIARLSPEDQIKYHQVRAAKKTPLGEYGRANALDHFQQQIGIMPGANESYRYRFICDALGLLLANKQIHDEANTTLFSKNTFVIMPEWERVHTFWRCDNNLCRIDVPCFIHWRNFKQIKHLYIIVSNRRAFEDPMFKVELANLEKNIKTMVRCILHAEIKLHTLEIRYTSCFDGEIETVRDNIEGEVPKNLPDRPTLITDRFGKYHHVKRNEAKEKLFKHGNVLESLRCLKGIASDVKMRGDLPQAYMNELVRVLTSPDKVEAVKAKQVAEQVARKRRHEEEGGSGKTAFWQQMVEKNKDSDPGVADLARQMLRTSVKSPGFFREFMKPFPMTMPNGRAANEGADEEDNEEEVFSTATSGGIGTINGKAVFGPVRPPPTS